MNALQLAGVAVAVWLGASTATVAALWIAAQHLDDTRLLHSVPTEGKYR